MDRLYRGICIATLSFLMSGCMDATATGSDPVPTSSTADHVSETVAEFYRSDINTPYTRDPTSQSKDLNGKLFSRFDLRCKRDCPNVGIANIEFELVNAGDLTDVTRVRTFGTYGQSNVSKGVVLNLGRGAALKSIRFQIAGLYGLDEYNSYTLVGTRPQGDNDSTGIHDDEINMGTSALARELDFFVGKLITAFRVKSTGNCALEKEPELDPSDVKFWEDITLGDYRIEHAPRIVRQIHLRLKDDVLHKEPEATPCKVSLFVTPDRRLRP
jgi:hypothetical protein